MNLDRVVALRAERAAMLDFCRTLDDAEWTTPSAAPDWRVQDVVAHVGSGCHAIFTPASLKMLRSKDIECTNDFFVDQRRDWPPQRTLAEYERWSAWLVRLTSGLTRTPLTRLRMPLAELGSFPAGLLIGGAMTFDQHTHLRHDIAPALGRPAPATDANRMGVVLEWMFAVLGNQLQLARPAWLTQPIAVELHGPGGGTWRIASDGSVAPGPAHAAVAQIHADALEFPAWATRRVPWRDREVTMDGDQDYGTVFLDAMNVV